MEGRTIARPDQMTLPTVAATAGGLQWRAGQLPGQTTAPARLGRRRASFNGGPDNCPARLGVPRHRHADDGRPSMEGRTIARPDWLRVSECWETDLDLQWRAGQLPGQTLHLGHRLRPRRLSFNGGPDNCPARPATGGQSMRGVLTPFNGGPDNCPARPTRPGGFCG